MAAGMGVSPDPGLEMTASRKKKLSASAPSTHDRYLAQARTAPLRRFRQAWSRPGTLRRAATAGGKSPPGARIAAYREHWAHARCIGSVRPDVRSWLEERAREHPTVEIPLRIAAGFEASGDEQGARRCRADAETAIRKLVAPFQRVPPDLEEEAWYPDEEPLLIRASYLLREVAHGAVPAAELMGEAGRCLQQLDLGYAADMIRSMRIAEAPDGPATLEAVTPGVHWRSSARHPASAVAETRTGHTARS